MLARRTAQWLSQYLHRAGTTSTLQPRRHVQSLPLEQPNFRQSSSVFDSVIRESKDQTVVRSSELPPVDILKHPDYFGVKKLFTVKEMFQCGVHLGHMGGTLNERMQQFIFGKRFNQLIFDLDITAEYLRDALNVLSHISYRGGIVLFVCRDRQNCHIVEQTAIDCGEYAHTRYWTGGTLTDATNIFGGATRLPDVLVFLSTMNSILEQHIAIESAAIVNIPTVGIVDTNCNPNLITYPVPGNDDSPSAIEFYCHVFKTAIQNAKQRRLDDDRMKS
ncbi:28S ribosomal protein S2, mitochondrial [Hypsibius exemplaris]|uniref:Small ribosomal subunit protein uS2m n=1 Tax=Hypsibius exemplaris TaxID=2072580 RepID=A0A1W0WAP2_HYPEX|nr:28S ribosomal protein S2, mitochondrial [Hypsibius exemplaris]